MERLNGMFSRPLESKCGTVVADKKRNIDVQVARFLPVDKLLEIAAASRCKYCAVHIKLIAV